MASTRLSPLARARAGSSAQNRQSLRHAHDLIIERGKTPGKPFIPVVKSGPPYGGRSSVSGHVVTIFGCTGFLGRFLTQKIARAGSQVIVPYRDEDEKRPLRVMGDLGQIVPMEWDATNFDQIYECMKHSDTVYNLVGRDWETRNFTYRQVNSSIAGRIAQIAREAKVPRLIHVSHLNANPHSPSMFYRTKHQGELLVRKEFRDATIVRPGPMYGAEDWLLRDMAEWPIKYRLNRGQTRMMPVHVVDVAEALATMLNSPITSTGSTFVLPGPESLTFDEMLNIVYFLCMKPRPYIPGVPKFVAKIFAGLINRFIWWPTMSPDEVERKYINDAGSLWGEVARAARNQPKPFGWESGLEQKYYGINGEVAKSWADLDIRPGLLQEQAVKYLRSYRDSENVDTPLEFGRFRPPKKYRVIP